MSQQTIRELPFLGRAYDQGNAIDLEESDPIIYSALRREILEGATPDEVEAFISALSGRQNDWYAKDLKSASRHIARQVENEKEREAFMEEHGLKTA